MYHYLALMFKHSEIPGKRNDENNAILNLTDILGMMCLQPGCTFLQYFSLSAPYGM